MPRRRAPHHRRLHHAARVRVEVLVLERRHLAPARQRGAHEQEEACGGRLAKHNKRSRGESMYDNSAVPEKEHRKILDGASVPVAADREGIVLKYL